MKEYSYEIFQSTIKSSFAFMPWKYTKEHNFSFNFYKKVWSDKEEARDDLDLLNYLFEKFNINHPKDFKGHSMSVSDIVRIMDVNGNTKYYYCDVFGWEDITKEMKGE